MHHKRFYLQVLRGLAALAVVYAHFIPLRGGVEVLLSKLHLSRLEFLVSGHVAVGAFFALSGFVLYERGYREAPIWRVLSGRYLRLMLPTLAATVVAMALISIGAIDFDLVRRTFGLRLDILPWSDLPDVWRGLFDAAVTIFTRASDASDAPALYDPVVWTISLEFFGSVVTLLAARLKTPAARTVAAAVPILPFLVVPCELTSLFACFAVGMLAAEHRWRPAGALAYAALGAALVVGCALREPFPVGSAWLLVALAIGQSIRGRLAAWLSSVGDMSFSLYLIHLLIWASLLTLVAHVAPWAGPKQALLAGAIPAAAALWVLIAAVYAALLWMLVPLFHRWIDTPALGVNRFLVRPRHTAALESAAC